MEKRLRSHWTSRGWPCGNILRNFGQQATASGRLRAATDLSRCPASCWLPSFPDGSQGYIACPSRIRQCIARGRSLAAELEEGTLVIAEQQSAGRGRLDRHWLSPPGGIYLTLVTRPGVAPWQAPRINLMVAVAISEVIERLYGLPARVKWPNDVLIEGRKVCGILAEMDAECDAVRFVNVGVGLNANSFISAEQPSAISLRELLGAPVDRVQLVVNIVGGILSRLPQLGSDSILEDWRARNVTIGRVVSIASPGGDEVRGIAIGINASGALLVEAPDGATREVMAGDCIQASY